MLQYEHNLQQQGLNLIAGIDEAGRGPLAGPVVVAGVIMPLDDIIEGINDSKKLSEKSATNSLSKSCKRQSMFKWPF